MSLKQSTPRVSISFVLVSIVIIFLAILITFLLPIFQFIYLTETRNSIETLITNNQNVDAYAVQNNFSKAYNIQLVIFTLFCLNILVGIVHMFVHRKQYKEYLNKYV